LRSSQEADRIPDGGSQRWDGAAECRMRTLAKKCQRVGIGVYFDDPAAALGQDHPPPRMHRRHMIAEIGWFAYAMALSRDGQQPRSCSGENNEGEQP